MSLAFLGISTAYEIEIYKSFSLYIGDDVYSGKYYWKINSPPFLPLSRAYGVKYWNYCYKAFLVGITTLANINPATNDIKIRNVS
jgi:hypothetical protein